MGCWFCGLDAPGLTGVFTYTAEGAALWRDVLHVLRDLCGEAAQLGFCYWATDPPDNPEYEHFIEDFVEIIGDFPGFTSARALHDPERTRSLVACCLDLVHTILHINRLIIET